MTGSRTVSGFRYRAFISYSHRDSAWADWLHRALENYAIPPRLVGLTTSAGVIPARLAPIFRDRDELPSATDLSAKVSDALAQSACLIVVCSPHSAQSPWVNEEIKTFQRLGRAERIFCVIVAGEPGVSAWPGREHDECLAPALTRRFDSAGQATGERLEPIAADARPGKDGKANARIKLVAGMLGVDLDDLKLREQHRRRWRVLALVGLGVALLALTTTLAVNAVIARHAAERRQKQAEDLVGFMLGDLDDKLRQVNRLDILESVADKAMKYFSSLPTSDMTDDTLAQRAQALLKIGAVRRDQGRIAEALDAFKLASESSERLLQRTPDNAKYQMINAESLTWIGFVDWSQGRLEEALARFLAARDMLLRASAAQPADTEILDQLGAAHTNAGRVFEARGQLEEARREYATVLDGYSYLSRREPDKLDWKTELGYAHNNLAQLALKEGALDEAVQEYMADRQIKANLHALDPGNNGRREDLVASEAFLGHILHLCGEPEAAQTHLRAAMDGIEALLAIDPNATDWIEKAGNYGWMSGQVARARGDMDEAARRDTAAVSRLRQLVAKDPGNVGWQRKFAQAGVENARRLLVQRQLAAAKDAANAANGAAVHAREGAPEDTGGELVVAQVQLVRGDIAAAAGDADAAQTSWSAAVNTARPRAASSRDPAVLDVWSGGLIRLGKASEAAPALAIMSRAGYREPDFMALVTKAGLPYPIDGSVTRRIAQLMDQAPASDVDGTPPH